MSKSKLQITINGKPQLTKSKQFLADAIHASGKGWLDGAVYATQDKTDPRIGFWNKLPIKEGDQWKGAGWMGTANAIPCTKLSPNWHQTVLSREEYFSAYPAEPVADADGWIDWKGGECPVDEGDHVDFVGRNYYGSNRLAGVLDWENITQYRLLQPAPAEKLSPEAVVNAPPPETINCRCYLGAPKRSIEQLAADYRNAKDFANRKRQEADDTKEAADAKLVLLVEAGKALGLDVSPIRATQVEASLATYKGDDW